MLLLWGLVLGLVGRGGEGRREEVTYGEGEEAETEEDAGVADEGEDIHLFNGLGVEAMGWMMGGGFELGELWRGGEQLSSARESFLVGKVAHEKWYLGGELLSNQSLLRTLLALQNSKISMQ